MIRVLVTGSSGCIGAATVQYLLGHGADEVVGFTRRGVVPELPEGLASRVRMTAGDIADGEAVRTAVLEAEPTHIIHLAAFQTPDCQAQPFRGMDINVSGTIHLLKAAAELGPSLCRVVCASSTAVYGPRAIYAGEKVLVTDPYLPPNLYGYWKVANEGAAQAFHAETGVPTLAVRLATTYGPGRDKGLTSAPTSAMKAVALGLPYRIGYQGREHYHYVGDVAAGFAQAALEAFDGYAVINLRGATHEVAEFCRLVTEVADRLGIPDADVAPADDASPMPFVCDVDDRDTVRQFPNMPLTSLEEGIEQSLRFFSEMASTGKLTPADIRG